MVWGEVAVVGRRFVIGRSRVPSLAEEWSFSRVNFQWWSLYRYPFHTSVTSVARKRPWPFCQKCRQQVTAKHAHTLNPMKYRMGWQMLCRHTVGTHLGNELIRNSSGNAYVQSFRLTEPLWPALGLKERNWCVWNDLCFEKKSAGGKWFVKPFPVIIACEEKDHMIRETRNHDQHSSV